jgi:hypothetical protein
MMGERLAGDWNERLRLVAGKLASPKTETSREDDNLEVRLAHISRGR